jgi:hypothetical protein
MQLIAGSEFFAWAAAHGIGRSVRWPNSEGLVFPHPADPPGGMYESWWGTWALPADQAAIPHFVRQLLAAGVLGQAVYVRPWRGWPTASDMVDDHIVWPTEAANLVAGWELQPEGDAVVRFAVEEHHHVAQLLAVCLAESAFNHLDVIPMDGHLVLSTCHDREAHADFPTRAARDAFDAALRGLGYRDAGEPMSGQGTA